MWVVKANLSLMANPFPPSLSPKQHKLLAMTHRRPGAKKFILASGPRMATKTTAALAAVAQNLWEVNNARFSVVATSVSAGDDSGCWTVLTTQTIPEWIAGDFGMEWVTTPKQNGVTKKLYFEVKNKWGGISRCQLDSLKNETEVEGRFKNKEYSGLYISELSNYKKRSTFDTWRQCLRGKSWENDDFIFIGDTNPAEEGKRSWIWQIWWDERLCETNEEGFRIWQSELGLMEFTVADNIFMDENWHKSQAAKYAHSEDLLRRYYYGEWVEATGNSIFHDQFRPTAHIIGEHETAVNQDPEVLVPDVNCSELITGWDAGVTNSAFMIIEKGWQYRKGKEVSIFNILDEVVFLKSDQDLDDFVSECMERILIWESWLGRVLHWRNWSDRSAFDLRGGLGNVYHHQLIRQMTEGKIILQAADRSPGSIRQRVDITKKLLFEDRLFISRSRCPRLIESFQGLPPGKAGAAIKKDSHFKHAFDACSYALVSEVYDEIIVPREESKTGKVSEGLVFVPI